MRKWIDIACFASGATEVVSVPAVIKVIAKAKEEHFCNGNRINVSRKQAQMYMCLIIKLQTPWSNKR